MKTISYVQENLNEAAKFLAKNNKHFLGQEKWFATQIFDDIKRHGQSGVSCIGTAGYFILFSEDSPGKVFAEVLVDPSVCIEQRSFVTIKND